MGMSEVHVFTATNANGTSSEFISNKDYLLLKAENAELKRKIELAKNQRDAWIGECYKEDFGLRQYTINKANEALKSIRGD